MKQYEKEAEAYAKFSEQKRTVEQVIIAFAPDENAGEPLQDCNTVRA